MKGIGQVRIGGLLARPALVLGALLLTLAIAIAGQMGPRTNYSADEIAAAVRNSNLNPTLMADADQMGNLGRFESSGNAGIYNGSCCTGIFQLNTENLRSYGLTREQYANMSLQDQTNIWADLTNKGMNSGPLKQLNGMSQFDGQPVDGAFKMACIQLGTGHCQTMLRSGSCSGFADKNGTTICDMAKSIRDGKRGKATGKGCQTPSDSGKPDGDGSGATPPAGQKNTTVPCKSASSSGGGSSKTCDANMKLQSGIDCGNFTGELASFCQQYKPKLMTRSDCDKAEKYAQGAKKGDRETECKNQTFGRGTGAWSYVLACSGTPSNQGEKGNGDGTTPGSGDNKNGTSTNGGNGNGDNNGTNTNGGSSGGTSTPGSGSNSDGSTGGGTTPGSGDGGTGSSGGSGGTGSDGGTGGSGGSGSGNGGSAMSYSNNTGNVTNPQTSGTPYVNSEYRDLIGTGAQANAKGNTECATLVQNETSGVGHSSSWSPGASVSGNPNIQPGTVVATFNSDGNYTNTSGQSHIGYYSRQDAGGIYLVDQYNGSGTVQERYYPYNNTRHPAESGSNFYIVVH